MEVIVPMPVGMLFFEVTAKREVDPHQRLLLVLAQGLIGQDQAAEVRGPVRRLEDARLNIERLG